MPVAERYAFGEFTIDVAERRLTRAGDAIPLPPKTFDLLTLMVRRAGTLVSKRALLDEVWRDTAVEEGILAVHVSALRKRLDDGSGRRHIETVARVGYRFTESVSRLPTRGEAMSLRWPVGVLPAQPAVSELIGRGRGHLRAASRQEVPQAVEAFRQAIALDPTYAAAHAGLALACCAQASFRLVSPADAYADARAAALRALAMDDSSADAQVALATVLFMTDWNWTGARRSVERALEIAPDHPEAWLLYGHLLDARGELAAGLAAKQKALEHHPSSAHVHMQIALSYWNQRQYGEVIAWANRALALDATHLLAREFIAAAYWKQGDFDRHMAETLAHAAACGAPASVLDDLRRVYDSGGRAAVVEYTLREAKQAPALQHAVLNGEAGRLDEAFRYLDLAIEARDPCLVDLAVAPQWDSLRGDPRFDERLRVMGLPDVPI